MTARSFSLGPNMLLQHKERKKKERKKLHVEKRGIASGYLGHRTWHHQENVEMLAMLDKNRHVKPPSLDSKAHTE